MTQPPPPRPKLTPSQITSNKVNQSKLSQAKLNQNKIAAKKTVRTRSPRDSAQQPGFPLVFYLAFCFVGLLIGLGIAGRLSYLVLGLYLIQNLLTYALYVDDKNAAINQQQRIPEYNLHVMSLIGGWPAAALAQQQHRHKTQKQPFKTIYWLTALIHSLAFAAIVI